MERRVRVLFMTKYSRRGASSRYRTLQYLPYFAARGMDYEVLPLLSDSYLARKYAGRQPWFGYYLGAAVRRLLGFVSVRQFDVVVIEKELFPYVPAIVESQILRLARHYTLDLDDALFHIYDKNRRKTVRWMLGTKFETLMSSAALVTVGNPHIADYARRYARNVQYLPTVINLGTYSVRPVDHSSDFVVGWIGTPNTQRYLHLIRKPLIRFFHGHQGYLLLVGASPDLTLEGVDTRIVPWSEEKEAGYIATMDIGIMPLPDMPFERGKSGLKLLQYMACGKPVVASPVGVNPDIVGPTGGFLANDHGQWYDALTRLCENPNLRINIGEAGRRLVEQKYNLNEWAPQYCGWIAELAAYRRRQPT